MKTRKPEFTLRGLIENRRIRREHRRDDYIRQAIMRLRIG